MAHDETLKGQLERTLVRLTGLASREVEHLMIDSIACDLHNEGYALEGNTAISDVKWLAQLMWYEEHRNSHINHFETLPETVQAQWIRTAEIAVTCLPALMSRIAHRAVTMSQALRGMERALRCNEKVKEENRTIEYQRKQLEDLRAKLKAAEKK